MTSTAGCSLNMHFPFLILAGRGSSGEDPGCRAPLQLSVADWLD